jgi:hypothetical protein
LPFLAVLPPGYEAWSLGTGGSVARHDVAAAVRAALECHGTLYAWAGAQSDRVTFAGRGEAYGVRLGGVPAVVRHARIRPRRKSRPRPDENRSLPTWT